MTDWQRSVLHKLVDRYEKSPAFRGEARVHREFAVKPREIETAYDGFELAVSERFDEEMKALVQQGLVTVKWARAPHQGIVHITARTDAWENIYEALGRKRADVVAGEWLAFFEKAGETEASKAYCAAECARIRSGKKPRQPVERAEKLIMLIDRVVNNDAWLLERELSAECLHDSKALEKYYRETLVNLLIAYSGVSYPLEDMENPEDMREKQRLVLAEHRIMPNPGYLYLKGDCEIRFSGGGNLRLTPQTQVALATESLARMERIAVGASGILSVENLTAYHRLQVPDRLMIYLGGFPQSAMVRLYRRIARETRGAAGSILVIWIRRGCRSLRICGEAWDCRLRHGTWRLRIWSALLHGAGRWKCLTGRRYRS